MSERLHYHDFIPARLRANERQTGEIQSPHVVGVTNRLSSELLQSPLRIIGNDGLPQPSPTKDSRDLIKEQIGDIVQESLIGLPLEAKEAQRIFSASVPLVRTITKSPYLYGIQQPHYLDPVRWAVEGARDPQLIKKTTIRVGFGGSDDDSLPLRFPAYLLPAIYQWTSIAEVLQKHDPSCSPRIELVFTPHFGANTNQMDNEKVHRHTQAALKISRMFAERFFPEVVSSIEYKLDQPLSQHPYAQLAINYLVSLVERAPDEVKERLQKFASNHGSANEFRKYAALHPVIFQDILRLPPLSTVMEKDRSSLVNITIGGRPEAKFNVVRALLSDQTTPEEFLEFVKNQSEENHAIQTIEWWLAALQQRRASYDGSGLNTKWANSDIPLLTLPLITNVGEKPVYYMTPFDLPLTKETITMLKREGIANTMGKIGNQTSLLPGQKHIVKSITRDLQALLNAVDEKELSDFYEEFLEN